MMKTTKLISTLVCATCIAFSALAQGLPKASQPEEVGVSSERLKRLTSAFQEKVDKKLIPGAVVLVARNGKVAYLEAFGFQDSEEQIPMKTDAIFKIASMTKPIVSVAAMMLVEEGRLQLNDPVSLYLPEFKSLQVGVEKVNPATGNAELSLEPVQRDMMVYDLMRHTSGLTYGFFGKSLVKQAYNDAKLFTPDQTLAELVTKLSKLPLAYQPETTWDYSMSTDVLGRVIEVVSGVSLDQFIAERITKPLGMSDTGFFVSEDKASRIAQPQIDPVTGKKPAMFPPEPTKRPNWMSGGGGLLSTASDYVRFAEMMLERGSFNGTELLSPEIVKYMTSDHLPPGIAFSPATLQLFHSVGIAPTPEDGQGFGLGFAIRTQEGRHPWPGAPGAFHWSGLYGITFWVDPKEKLIGIMMLQIPVSPETRITRSLIRSLVYQALKD